MLRQFDLDDERFSELANRARLKAPEYFPAWNDLNTHDPGVTLIELFAWLTEMQRFHLDQSEDASVFFPLLGITPRLTSASETDVTIPGGLSPRDISECTALYAGDVRFETMSDVRYDGNPRSVRVIQRETVRTPFSIGYAVGFPDTALSVDTRGQAVLHDCFSLEVDGEKWVSVADFHASRPFDRHYTLNCESGEILFGNGIHGAIPRGDVVVTAMALTLGAGGNIAPHRLTELDGLPVSQPNAAHGGAAKETVNETTARAVGARRRAVTPRDIERLVTETPGLKVARVRSYESDAAPKIGEPRVITIAVNLESGELSEDIKERIRGHLEPYRMVCREFRIIAPELVDIGLVLELRAGPRGAGFNGALERMLEEYFARYYSDFGAVLRISDIRALIAGVPEVLEVSRCAFRVHGGARTDSNGDIHLPPDRLARLNGVILRVSKYV